MDKTVEKIASGTLEETLQSMNVSTGTTYPATLFRSKTSGQVLYLEAGKDFVDTLLSFLLLPVGTIIHLLSTGIQVTPTLGGALGGISSIFESVQSFTASDLQLAKEHLVQPRPAIGCACKSCNLPMQIALEKALILPSPRQRLQSLGEYYECSTCKNLAPSIWKDSVCTPCKSRGYTYNTYSQGPYSVFPKEPDYYTAGFVKVNTTFIITDSLEIMPLTTIQSLSVLSRLRVATLADLEGNNITVSLRQILQLLHSSLSSNSCLNEVFGTSKSSTLRWDANSVASIAFQSRN